MAPGALSGPSEYLPAFEQAGEDFLFFYSPAADGRIQRRRWRRGDFLNLAAKAAGVLRSNGLAKGDGFCLCVGANQPFDLAFRLGAVLTATVPVTINWQADTAGRICYKIEQTAARLIVSDALFDPDILAAVKRKSGNLPVFQLERLDDQPAPAEDPAAGALSPEATRLVVFTSGTTGQPKGVALSYRAYRTNRETFENFLEISPGDKFAVLIVNPLHHANSSAITDWAMRRPGTHIHLMSRYATAYWEVLTRVADTPYDRLLAPTVSRHFDFLAQLDAENRLPVPLAALTAAMGRTDFLIGSAPVGPTTIARLRRYAGRIPAVRFGATETCLQAIGIPMALPEEAKQAAFEKGWMHRTGGDPLPGYYVGRPHPPFTDARIVKSVSPGQPGFMENCAVGRPGYLITAGENLMSGYVSQPEATRAVFHGGWYLGLKDIAYTLVNDHDGELDFYWVSRESTMLIRGGANYAYEQINEELRAALMRHHGLDTEDIDVAVVGLKVDSEHEDSCCATVARKSRAAETKLPRRADGLKKWLNQNVSKAATVDYLRYGEIPRSFKGAVLTEALAADFGRWLTSEREAGFMQIESREGRC